MYRQKSPRESLELLIKFAGCQRETFASAEEFLARPRTETLSCLVLDVSLPALNGLELQKLVGTDRVDMPIIFMTAQAMKAGAHKDLIDAELLAFIKGEQAATA